MGDNCSTLVKARACLALFQSIGLGVRYNLTYGGGSRSRTSRPGSTWRRLLDGLLCTRAKTASRLALFQSIGGAARYNLAYGLSGQRIFKEIA
ncbi:MAG: hypothetical protein Rhob2KO_37540 [Rhodopirellula baltica]